MFHGLFHVCFPRTDKMNSDFSKAISIKENRVLKMTYIPNVSKNLSRRAIKGDLTALKRIINRNSQLHTWANWGNTDMMLKRNMLAWVLFGRSINYMHGSHKTNLENLIYVYTNILKDNRAKDVENNQIELASKWFKEWSKTNE